MALVQMWMRRWRPAVALGLIAAAATAMAGLHARPIYSASAMVVVDQGEHDIVPMSVKTEETYTEPGVSAVDTKVLLASSLALAERVVQRENLVHDPEFNGTADVPGAPPPTLVKVAESLKNSLQIRRVGLTSTIQMTARSHDPVKAARLANAVADEFINWEFDSKIDLNSRSNQFINEHLAALQRDAQNAESAVEQYKIAHNLLSSAGETLAEQQVGNLGEQIASAQADLAEKEARLAAANAQNSRGGDGQDVTAALNSVTVTSLRSQQAEASRTLAELKAHYGPRYPDVQKAESQLADINAKIQDEANRIHSSLQSDVQAAAQRLRSLRESQNESQGNLASNTRAEAGLAQLQQRAQASEQLYEAFLNRSKETSVQGAQQPDAQVFDKASVPGAPTFPNPRIIFVVATLAAIFVSAVTIAVLELLDSSLRTSDEVVKRLGLPVLGVVPTPESAERRFTAIARLSPEQYLLKKPFSVFAEAFRTIRTSVVLPDPAGRKNHVIAIASALPQEGKSTSAFCLMRTLALAGTTVVLVDGDLRRRGASSFVKAVDGHGLVEVLEGRSDVASALVYDLESSGWVLPVTGSREGQTDLFSSPKMDDLIAELRSRFDIVLIDTPATLAVADARVLAAKADAVYIVTKWAKTPSKATAVAIEALVSAGANVIGVVLNCVDLRRQVRHSYGDASGYYRQYAQYYQN